MECPSQDNTICATVLHTTSQFSAVKERTSTILLTPETPVESIYKTVAETFGYDSDQISLILQVNSGPPHALALHRDKTLDQIGVPLSQTNIVITVSMPGYKKMALDVQETYEDDLLLGASASPTMGDVPSTSSQRDVLPAIEAVPLSCSYVGLVNQAMTCYLNSLLQALYMTPEFRNALYNWEFDGVNESRSIPYQLQKLFLNLQTSSKSAVETTDLTTSFGWQGSDAWHQHDIQELCRVMFDALEQKFKDTKQANLINDLYEGKMLDYVKCLECGTEKSREDTFLDIPLPVRAFCSTLAYNSLEEALRAFVLPETLDGNNQYYCEKCNKKCDAHKGLKFTKFPYLLTLHLKRFDFDYNTMHRIKLNDKVVFPEKLNLNSFITHSQVLENESTIEEKEHVVKCDECSTTDSGSADDESCQGTDISSTVNGHDDNCVDSDEGIDVSLGNNHHEEDMKGPYVYELFSIMIHSGSASGGHYYAYIKDFERNMWFCFNDQTVSGITEDDIRKTYGGGPLRGYYSGAYSSSTNAYMLMYRQIDKERNALAMSVEEFPPHIKTLLEDMRRKEEEDRRNKEKENDMIKVTVFCIHPMSNELIEDGRLNLFFDNTMEEAKYDAIRRLKLESFVNPNDCRLVLYNRKQDCIDKSFESDQIKVCDALRGHYRQPHLDLFLEIKDSDAQWETYKAGGINMRVYPIVLETEDIEECKLVRVDIGDTVGCLKLKLSTLLDMDSSSIKIVQVTYSNEPKYLEKDDQIVEFDFSCLEYRLYVSNCLDEDSGKQFQDSKLKRLINQFEYVISLNIILPKTDIGTLESLSIPSLDLNQNLDKLELGGGDRGINSPSLRVSPQPYQSDGIGDQSNSEDSSLSDSDRTLVGATPGECGGMGLLSSCPNSPADQHMASPSDHCEEDCNTVQGYPSGEEMSWDEVETNTNNASMFLYIPMSSYYFKVTSIGMTSNSLHYCRVLADKRMTLEQLKKHLEEVVRVPSEYFKVHKYFQGMEDEWSCLTDTLRSGCAKDGEKLIVHLGRVPRKDEVKCAIYHLKLNVMDPNVFLFDHIFAKGQTVKEVKREIVLQAKKQKMLDIPLNKCRLREKSCKRPRKIYFDEQQFVSLSIAMDKDIHIVPNMEMYVQELDDVEKVTSPEQMVLFIRQYCPSTLTLKQFQEVALDDSAATLDQLKEKIADISGIPLENVEVAYVKDNIPCDMNVLEINNELDWNPNATTLKSWPLKVTDGNVFYYRDSRETLKELTREEREEVIQRENARLGKPSLKSFSPGRERALKIYLDTPPVNNTKTDDACID